MKRKQPNTTNTGAKIKSNGNDKGLGEILKSRRVTMPLTLQELADVSGVSPSHVGRIERGERFPSAAILRRIAKPLGFEESELFALAGYLSSQPSGLGEKSADYTGGQLDPYVGRVLNAEPVAVQRAAIGILMILKTIAKAVE